MNIFRPLIKLIILAIMLGFSTPGMAQKTLYVSDNNRLAVHSGPSNKFRIIAFLKSGTAVTELEIDENTGYSKIQTPKGKEGWILSKDLMTQPSAKDRLRKSQNTIEGLKKKNAELTAQLFEVSDSNKKSEGNVASLSRKNQNLAKELENIKKISSRAIELNDDNNRLLEENQNLKNQVDILTTDNQRLVDDRSSEEFINGAFAVLIGVMITLAVPRLMPKKRTDWA